MINHIAKSSSIHRLCRSMSISFAEFCSQSVATGLRLFAKFDRLVVVIPNVVRSKTYYLLVISDCSKNQQQAQQSTIRNLYSINSLTNMRYILVKLIICCCNVFSSLRWSPSKMMTQKKTKMMLTVMSSHFHQLILHTARKIRRKLEKFYADF